MSLFGLVEKRSETLANPGKTLLGLFGGRATRAGLSVSEQNALSYTAVYACVQVIAEAMACLPMNLYRKTENGQEIVTDLPQANFFNHAANAETGAASYKSTKMGWVLTWGNGYSEIERDNAGRPLALHQLPPIRIVPQRRSTDFRIEYIVTRTANMSPYYLEQPGPTNIDARIDRDDMLHVAGLGFDGIMGYSPIAMAREAIGLGLAAESYGAKYFGNSGIPSGVLTSKGKIVDPKKLREQWNATHGGDGQRGTAVLENGVEWKGVGLPPEDSQFLETRKFQRGDVASIYRVPPHKIGDLDRSTNNNIEQQSLDFIMHCLFPWCTRWEQEADRKLLSQDQRRAGYYYQFDYTALMNADMAALGTFIGTMRQWGIFNADDARARLKMNKLPDRQGQIFLMPSNMQPADKAHPVIDSMIAANHAKANKKKKAEGTPAPAKEDDASNERIRSNLRGLLLDAAERAVRKEISAIKRAAKKPESFAAVAGDFYEDHEDNLRGMLLPVAASFADIMGTPFADARAAVMAVKVAPIGAADVEKINEGERAAAIADSVLAAMKI